jgi:hypothetical protein
MFRILAVIPYSGEYFFLCENTSNPDFYEIPYEMFAFGFKSGALFVSTL